MRVIHARHATGHFEHSKSHVCNDFEQVTVTMQADLLREPFLEVVPYNCERFGSKVVDRVVQLFESNVGRIIHDMVVV